MKVASVTSAENGLKSLSTKGASVPLCPREGALLMLEGCGLCGSDLEKLGLSRPASNGSVLGHEVVGRIHELGSSYHGAFQVGDRLVVAHHVPCLQCVYCQQGSQSMCRQFKQSNLYPGGFAEQIALTDGHLEHTAFRLPETLPLTNAICVEPLACVLKALRRSSTQNTQSALVIGLGFIGLLAMQAYSVQSITTYGLERSAERIRWIESQSALRLEPGQIADQPERLLLPETGVDTIFLTVVTPQTVATALHCIRDGGTVVLFASPHSVGEPDMDLLGALYFREISLISSYSPGLEDLQEAHRWVLSGRIALTPLVTHTVPLQDIGAGVELARRGEAVKVLVKANG